MNSFRPQHNNNTQRARDIVNWCWEQGIQQVFNADEKWVPDVVEHFRSLAKQYKEYPADAVAYDLLNEPETRDPRAYRTLIQAERLHQPLRRDHDARLPGHL